MEPSMVPVVTNVYKAVLKPKSDAYRGAFDAIAVAESQYRLKEAEVNTTLVALVAPYKSARSAVLAVQPTKVLPETLSVQTTDTDVLYAIETLLSAITEHAGETWADELLSGQFGLLSAKSIEQIEALVEASKAVTKAREARGAAAGLAYKAFVAFRRVVRDALGTGSKQYRRLHVRGSKAREETANGEGAPAEAANGGVGAGVDKEANAGVTAAENPAAKGAPNSQ